MTKVYSEMYGPTPLNNDPKQRYIHPECMNGHIFLKGLAEKGVVSPSNQELYFKDTL